MGVKKGGFLWNGNGEFREDYDLVIQVLGWSFTIVQFILNFVD